MRAAFRISLAATGVLLVAFAVSACGSEKEASTTTATTTSTGAAATASWASDLCTSLNTWKSSLTSARAKVKGDGVSKANLQEAGNTVSEANTQLQDDVEALGKPPTPAAAEAKTSVQQLQQQLRNQANRIDDAVSGVSGVSDLSSAVSTTTGALTAMRDDLSATANKLGSLPGESEWDQAFADSAACGELTNG